jgi:hypothetical protein
MDTRIARRAAEKAARDLMKARSAVIGDLGVVNAERLRLAADVDTAAEEGRRLRTAAETRASELRAAARDVARAGEQRYVEALAAAVSAGWTLEDLSSMGFQDVRAPSRRGHAESGRASARGAAHGHRS